MVWVSQHQFPQESALPAALWGAFMGGCIVVLGKFPQVWTMWKLEFEHIDEIDLDSCAILGKKTAVFGSKRPKFWVGTFGLGAPAGHLLLLA